MKINLIKLLCMALILALMLALVGCKNADDTNNSSTLTSSAVDAELNDDTAKAIVYNYYNLMAHFYGNVEDFVDFFNLVDKVEFDEKNTVIGRNEELDIEGQLWKTNVKYKDLKNGLLKYVSKSIAEETFLRDDLFAEKDGYLYTYPVEGGGMHNDVLDAKLLKENNGKYEYQVKCIDDTYDDAISEFEVKATIIKQNGVYVLDSIEEIKE